MKALIQIVSALCIAHLSCFAEGDALSLSDASGVFSGRSIGGVAKASAPELSLVCRSAESGPCIHSAIDYVDYAPVFRPLSATVPVSELSYDGFSLTTNGYFRLVVPDVYPRESGGSVWVSSPPLAWGMLYDSKSVHRCEGGIQEFCPACGRHHSQDGDHRCGHSPDCDSHRDASEPCSCEPLFIPVNWDDDNWNWSEDRHETSQVYGEDDDVRFRVLGIPRSCCCDSSFGFESHVSNVIVSSELRLRQDGDAGQEHLCVEAIAAPSTVGGASITYGIYDRTNGLYRTITRRVTAANVRARLDRNDDGIAGWDDQDLERWYGPVWTVYRRNEPYSFWLECEKPLEMEIAWSSTDPLRISGLPNSPFSASEFPISCLIDASCSNTTFEVQYALVTGGRTFVSSSFVVKVVDTAIPERTILIGDQAGYSIADLDEIYWEITDLSGTEFLESGYGQSVSLGSTLGIGDYLVSAYMSGIGDCGSTWHCSTNVLHVRGPTILSVDLKDSVNELTHHTELYATNALVVRRAQKFSVETKMSKNFDPDRFRVSFKMVDEFGDAPTTNDVPFSAGDMSHTDWYARKVGDSTTSDNYPNVLSDVSLPSTNCAVGVYHLIAQVALKSDPTNFLHSLHSPRDIIVLFNPWSRYDSVYVQSEVERDEYVLNDSGKIWKIDDFGNPLDIDWYYAQFHEETSRIFLSTISTAANAIRCDTALLSRYFSSEINSNGGGILEGRWTADFVGGVPPGDWRHSLQIIAAYQAGIQPVKYGQCWVFAGLLNTFLRTAGIPCRVITNYESGHDYGHDKTIDIYIDRLGRVDSQRSDSIWNYHVWCEAWMNRPDLGDDICGWQVVDATPQELSGGQFQCGPAPVKSIKLDLGGNYDVDFVYSEVAAKEKRYRMNRNGTWVCFSERVDTIGTHVLTKEVGGDNPVEIKGDYK